MAKEGCVRYNSYVTDNQTIFLISTKYEFIPQNFVINILAYAILIGLFICLRKRAWNYGKLAWINRPVHDLSYSSDSGSFNKIDDDVLQTSEDKPLKDVKTKSFKKKLWKLIPLFLKLNDEQLRVKCGPDAVIYCQFQRYLITTVAVMVCFSLIIIVPINLKGQYIQNDSAVFSTLTIANVRPDSSFLWAHVIVALTLMLFTFVLSANFLQKIDDKNKSEFSSTIMIRNIPLECCDEVSIQTHFQEAFPSTKVIKVQLAHKVNKLINIDAEKKCAEEALEYCCNDLDCGAEPVMVVPHACGRRMACECCTSESCVPVDGVTYYKNEVIRLSNLFIEEKSRAVNENKLPIVFVTFENVQQSFAVRRDYVYQNYCCVNVPSTHLSHLSKEMGTAQWKVTFAPMVEDILWHNLHKRGWKWWLQVAIVNLVVIIVVLMFSTPALILTGVDNFFSRYNISQELNNLKMGAIADFFPPLILMLVNSLIPILVYWSDQLSGHWTKTSQNMAIMNKLYAILVMNVLILPSLGLTGMPALKNWLFPPLYENRTNPDPKRFDCIFLPGGGSLFCNYLITATFIGTSLELLRLGALFLFSWRVLFSKSRAEDQSIAKDILWEFEFGLGYAWTLSYFTMISAYAVIVPIITPFGLAYLLLKHAVDRYNLIHVNSFSLIQNSIHSNAAQLMQIGLVLTQTTVTIYVVARGNSYRPLAICCYMAFVLGILLAFGRTAMRWIKSMACIKYSTRKRRSESNNKDTIPDNSYDEDFILVDDFRNSIFIPLQLAVEQPTDIDEILRRKSVFSSQLSAESQTSVSGRRNYGSR